MIPGMVRTFAWTGGTVSGSFTTMDLLRFLATLAGYFARMSALTFSASGL
jgi:hypothetical protein